MFSSYARLACSAFTDTVLKELILAYYASPFDTPSTQRVAASYVLSSRSWQFIILPLPGL